VRNQHAIFALEPVGHACEEKHIKNKNVKVDSMTGKKAPRKTIN